MTREVLRWEETLLINEAAARLDPDFAACDVLLVLLASFTPRTAADDRRQIHARMRKAFASLGVLSASLINRCVRRCVTDATDLKWEWHAKHGWVLPLYPRKPDGDFPFKHFAGLIEAAKLTCKRRARRAPQRRRPAAPPPPRPKPAIVIPAGTYTRAQLMSSRLVFAKQTPAAGRRSSERSFQKSVAAALAAIDAVPKAKAVVISRGRVKEVMTRMPAKRKLGFAK